MNRLIPINSLTDIPESYRDTPIGTLLEYHDLGRPIDVVASPQLLIAMCMDNRKHLTIPDNFAFIIRSGGANLRRSSFKVSYAISVGGVRHIAIIGHTNCGMVHLADRKEQFIQGLINAAGWTHEHAEEHFDQFAPMFEIGNEIDFVLSEAIRIRAEYPTIVVAPMIYRVEDNRLYPVSE
ncbi:MAG: carbonic anhydrase [bacterium]